MPPKIGPIDVAKVREALPLAKEVATAVDVDKDKKVDGEEISRIKIRDQFVTRDLLKYAWPYMHDPPISPQALKDGLDRAMRSLERADNGDGVLTEDELKKASKAGRQLALFAKLHEGKSIEDFQIKPYEKPGTKAWGWLAASHYYDKDDGGQPRFGTALVVSRDKLPASVARTFDAWRAEHPDGVIEACRLIINKADAWFVHVKTDSRVDVLVMDAKGKRYLEGTALSPCSGPERHTKHWKLTWREAA